MLIFNNFINLKIMNRNKYIINLLSCTDVIVSNKNYIFSFNINTYKY